MQSLSISAWRPYNFKQWVLIENVLFVHIVADYKQLDIFVDSIPENNQYLKKHAYVGHVC